MPNARTHDKINITTYGALLISYTLANSAGITPVISEHVFVGFTLGFAAGTYLLSPDLDLRQSRPKKRWGPLRILWRPYTTLMPHRGLSHGYVIGPLTRIAYLLVLLTPLYLYTPLHSVADALWGHVPSGTMESILIGYYLSTWVHLMADRAPFQL